MPTYEVIAGAHGIDGKLLRVGARFEKGAGFEAAEHFSRCFKKVNTGVEDKAQAEAAEAKALADEEASAAKALVDEEAAKAKALADEEAAEAKALAEEEAAEAKALADEEAAEAKALAEEEVDTEVAALNAQLSALGWDRMKSFSVNSSQFRKYKKTPNGKKFLKTKFGKDLIAASRK